MAKQVETIWDYLESHGYSVAPRPEKKLVHLALESDKMNNAQQKRMPSRYDWSLKLDGIYSLVTLIPILEGEMPEYEVRHWGRSGKAQVNLESLDDRISEALFYKRNKQPIILISEVTSRDPLAKLSGYVNPNRVNEGSWEPTGLRDNFHDILTVDEFIQGNSEMTYFYRKTNLQYTLADTGLSIIDSVGYHTYEEAKQLVKGYWSEGGEGYIGRDIHKDWVAGARNETVIKLKEKLSYDVTVVGMVSGKKGSKYEGTLGKLVVAFRAFGEPDGELLYVPISGMADAQREAWWNDPTLIVGATVKMDAKSFTENGNLREPRYKETRNDKSSDFPVKVSKSFLEYPKGQFVYRDYRVEVL